MEREERSKSVVPAYRWVGTRGRGKDALVTERAVFQSPCPFPCPLTCVAFTLLPFQMLPSFCPRLCYLNNAAFPLPPPLPPQVCCLSLATSANVAIPSPSPAS